MENKGRKIGSIVLVVLIAYFLLGLVGVLPEQYDLIKRGQGTQVEYGEIIYPYTLSPNAMSCIVTDSQNNVWFTNGYTIGKLTAETYQLNEFDISPYYSSYGISMDVDSSNNVWVSLSGNNKIGMLPNDAESGDEFVSYNVPTLNSFPSGVAVDSLNNVWFTEEYKSKIGKLPYGGSEEDIVEFSTPSPSSGRDIAVDSQDNIWFSYNNAQKICKIPYGSDSGDDIIEYNIVGYANCIAIDSQDNVWFTETTTNKIIERTYEGDVIYFDIPTAECYPYGIAVDTQDNIWFAENYGHKIAILPYNATSGEEIEEYILSIDSYPKDITTDSSDNIWFCERNTNRIGELPVLNPPAPSPPPSTGEFAFTQVGQWTEEGDGRAPFEYVGEDIPITVEIETNETIETASLLWQDVGESDWNFGDMSQGQDGAWRFNIPKQEREGTVYYQVQATTSEGAELFSDTYGVQVLTTAETPTPSEPLVNPTVFYGVGTLLLVAIGVAINMPSKKYN